MNQLPQELLAQRLYHSHGSARAEVVMAPAALVSNACLGPDGLPLLEGGVENEVVGRGV